MVELFEAYLQTLSHLSRYYRSVVHALKMRSVVQNHPHTNPFTEKYDDHNDKTNMLLSRYNVYYFYLLGIQPFAN